MKSIENRLLRIARECKISPENADNISIILGLICFKRLSESVRKDVNNSMHQKGITDFEYQLLSDVEAKLYKEDVLLRMGYFLYPSQLYENLCNSENKDILREIAIVFRDFQDIDNESMSIGNTSNVFSKYSMPSNMTGYRNEQVKELSNKLNALFQENAFKGWGDVDLFDGLISNSLRGRNGSEFYLPGNLAELMVRLVTVGNSEIKTIYNPCCGYGTLMSQFSKVLKDNFRHLSFLGIDKNHHVLNLCWLNLVINTLNLNQFCLKESNPLECGGLTDSDKFDIIITSYAKDLSIVDHILRHLEKESVAALLTFPGVLYRSGRDKEIRERLIAKNLISAIIQLPSNILSGNGIAPCIIVLSNKKKDNFGIRYINASEECIKVGLKNVVTEETIKHIIEIYSQQKDLQGITRFVSREEIIENECSLNISNYIQPYSLIDNPGTQNSNSDWSRTYKFNNSTLTIRFGDVITSKAEVIVSSDDTEISMGGGVSQSILEAGGEFVKEDAQKKLPAMLGDVVVSTAGKLANQKFIFHCLTIDYDRDMSFYKEKLSGQTSMNDYIINHCVEECFRLMQALNIKSIAFPLIGSGIAGIDMNLVAKVMSDSLAELLSHTSNPYQIELFLLDRFGEKKEFDYLSVFEYFGVQEKLIQKERNYLFDDESEVINELEIPNMVQDYPVFISFSDSDWDIVKKLILQVLNKEGIECFAYKKENYAGANYQDKIIHAINHAKVVIFACSNKSMASDEVRNELFYSRSRKKLIIPVKLDSSSTDWYDYNFMQIDYIDPKHMPNAIHKLIKRVKFEIKRNSSLQE